VSLAKPKYNPPPTFPSPHQIDGQHIQLEFIVEPPQGCGAGERDLIFIDILILFVKIRRKKKKKEKKRVFSFGVLDSNIYKIFIQFF
jgi:hypothetical protein